MWLKSIVPFNSQQFLHFSITTISSFKPCRYSQAPNHASTTMILSFQLPPLTRRLPPQARCQDSANQKQKAHNAYTHLPRRRLLSLLPVLVPFPIIACAGTAGPTVTDEEWKRRLSESEYAVLRRAGTERPFSSPLNGEVRPGTFLCAACNNALFSSTAKFDSGTGWPSFFAPLPSGVKERQTMRDAMLMQKEVVCASCEGHLGHVFRDGPKPTGLRYCMNGVALRFLPD